MYRSIHPITKKLKGLILLSNQMKPLGASKDNRQLFDEEEKEEKREEPKSERGFRLWVYTVAVGKMGGYCTDRECFVSSFESVLAGLVKMNGTCLEEALFICYPYFSSFRK